ncbi:ABC transporter permease subunit [Amycolatopsis sp. RM579]|uniref:ABC transporter permease subunit n=1 Tax=Amycolatopsis pithecellobii TaxID=664692 RepID=A0A6N7Z5K7_9PSEU|nr:ABC transporter permease subunit [Amycolatopsis pithecellobii]
MRYRFLRRFVRQRLAVGALIFLLLVLVTCVLAPLIAPYDPLAQDLSASLLPPSGSHWLGTDLLGRDVFSRLLYGGRVSLQAAGVATATALVIGVIPGLAAGYLGRRVDQVIMALTDALMSFPALVLAIGVISVTGAGVTNAMLAVGVIVAPRVLRLVRSTTMHIKEETYVEAARSIGTSTPVIIFRHILPNVLPPLIVFTSLLAGATMLVEASLSFIGLGVRPPDASWGTMLGDAFSRISQAPTLILFPGAAIALTVLALNLFGDGIRDSIGRESRR